MMTQSREIKGPKSFAMNAEVCAIKDITPHLRQVTLKHELFKEVGPLAPGVHFKVFIPSDKTSMAVLPDLSGSRPFWPNEKTKPYVRTYTIRNLDRISGILDVEFVLHGDSGPASAWANNVAVGDYLGIGIKKSGKIHDWVDWYLFAGDETATPAIAAMLEALPAETTGIALLEVATATDIFKINTKSSVEIRWLCRNGVFPEKSELILHAVAKVLLPEPSQQSRYVWIAGEDNMVRLLRRYVAEKLILSREELHATVYWKSGISEDSYQKVRRQE